MITIVNVGATSDQEAHNPGGLRNYEVRIWNGKSEKVIATFQHRRSAGLGICLLEASKAIERAKWTDAAKIFESMQEQGTDTGDW